MTKILIGVVVVALIGAGAWFVLNQPSDETPGVESERVTQENSDADMMAEMENAGFGSLASLFGRGENIRCDFTSTFEGEEASGTFYTNGENFRVDSEYSTADGVMTSSMINDGEYMYTWGQSPEGAMAVKMPILEAQGEGSVDYESDDNEASFDIDQQVDYDCARWSVDASVFVPPSDVTFMDMEAMMQGMMEGMPAGMGMPGV